MHLTTIVSYLVYPGKGQQTAVESPGVSVPLKGNLFKMLAAVFDKSDAECKTPVRFTMSPDGSAENEARDLIVHFANSRTLKAGRQLAHRLRDRTTKKSGLGLLFIMHAADAAITKLVISRFPAEEGVLAEEDKSSLKVEFIERIFMKNSASYKAALYEGGSFDKDFWSGFVVDRQLNESTDQIANYWIRDFLASDYKTTSKAGTRRLAIALREATHSGQVGTKQEIVAAITLAKGMFGKTVTIASLMQQLSLSEDAQAAIISHVPDPSLIGDTFVLDGDEFLENAPLAMVELHTGGLLVGPADQFNDTFKRELLTDVPGQYRFTTVGRIVDERLRGRRP